MTRGEIHSKAIEIMDSKEIAKEKKQQNWQYLNDCMEADICPQCGARRIEGHVWRWSCFIPYKNTTYECSEQCGYTSEIDSQSLWVMMG